MTTIESAGYIVYSNETIWGTGPTADAAWESFRAEMSRAGIKILSDDDEDGDEPEAWTRERDYRIRSASRALLEDAERFNGEIPWRVRGGVACTVAEDEAA
jgi:hypothetical protein